MCYTSQCTEDAVVKLTYENSAGHKFEQELCCDCGKRTIDKEDNTVTDREVLDSLWRRFQRKNPNSNRYPRGRVR